MAIKAYSYIRFSTPEQAQGDSLRRQTAEAEVWAKKRNIVLDNSLKDLGVSAYRGANRTTGALRSFLKMVEEGKVDRGSYLIVESLDRISRETVMEASARLFDLIRAGIIVVTLSDGQEYSEERLSADWTPLVVSLVVMARAHEESRIKSMRIGKAWQHKREAARNYNTPMTSICPEWLEIKNNSFIIRKERAAIVHRIFQDTIKGFGRREIVRRLNEEGVPTSRRGNGWQTSSIARIIQNKAVLGEYQPHSGSHRNHNRKPVGEPIQNYFPRIIDDETYWRAQSAVASRRQSASGRKGRDGAHILQGLGKCGSCSGSMHIVNKGKPPKGNIYLACSSNLRKAGCSNNQRIRVDSLEKKLLKALLHVNASALDSLEGIQSSEVKEIEALRAKLTDAKFRRTHLIKLVETGDEEAAERFSNVSKEVHFFAKELHEKEHELRLKKVAPNIIEHISSVGALTDQLDNADANAIRELRIKLSSILRALVECIDCRPIGPILILKPRFEYNMKGVMPFALQMSDSIIRMLLVDSPSKEVSKEFFDSFNENQ
ncbi:MAG: recombinase family protein [Bacteroidia bacterium]